jgi:hypothetical protein
VGEEVLVVVRMTMGMVVLVVMIVWVFVWHLSVPPGQSPLAL